MDTNLYLTNRGITGNVLAASDLYGNGVRIGIYLQVLGMTLSCVRLKSKGLKLTCAASMLAILASWSILARRQDFSPAEAWMILSLSSMLFIPASSAISVPDAQFGEGIAMLAVLVAQFWFIIAYFWMWGTLYRTLPSLGTPNVAWFFVKVNLKNWFRIYMLVQGSILFVPGILVQLIFGWQLMALVCKAWLNDWSDWSDVPSDGFGEEEKKMAELSARGLAVFGFVWWILGIAGLEVMIKANQLTPANDFTAPGQSIPLAIGVIVLLDGIFAVFKERPKGH